MTDASALGLDDAIQILREEAAEAKRPEIVPNAFAVRARRKQWRDAVERALAACEADRVDPRLYLRCLVDTTGYAMQQRRLVLQPAHLCSTKSMERYAAWVTRKRAMSGRSDIGMGRDNDEALLAERRFVHTYAAAEGRPHAKRMRLAKEAARGDGTSSYHPDRKRRLIALCDYLHGLHPDLPDVLVLHDDWRLRHVFRIAKALLTR